MTLCWHFLTPTGQLQQQITLLEQSWLPEMPPKMPPSPAGQACLFLSNFWQVLPTLHLGALGLAVFPERNL